MGERVVTPVEIPAVGVAAVGEEHGACVIRLGHIGQEIKGSVVVDEEGLWVSALTSDVVRTLHRIADEEDGPVQTDDIVVAFLGVELDRETSRIASEIGKLLAKRDGGEAQEQRSLLADLGEECGLCQMGYILGDLEVAEVPRSGRVHTTLDDLLADECLLLLEEEGVAGDRKTADVERMRPVRRPRCSEVGGNVLAAIGVLRVGRFDNARGFGSNLCGATIMLLEAERGQSRDRRCGPRAYCDKELRFVCSAPPTTAPASCFMLSIRSICSGRPGCKVLWRKGAVCAIQSSTIASSIFKAALRPWQLVAGHARGRTREEAPGLAM
ncbi:hypothetical protein MRB53_037526 [Persea americana]|nr:hypothetical protein MRB53_037526 [Persea americana]